ncbi:MAG: ATP-binding protein [bacterium]
MRTDSPLQSPGATDAVPADAARLLQELGSMLMAPSLDAALPGAIRLIGALAGARVAGLILLKENDLGSEHWHGDESLRLALRGELVKSALRARDDRTGSVRTVQIPAGLHLIWTTPVASPGAAPLGAITLAFPEAPGLDRDFDAAGVERLAELIAAKVATSRELAVHRSEKARYERWFRTLDAQLRVLDRERQKFVAVVNQSDTYMFVVNGANEVQWMNSALTASAGASAGGERALGGPLDRVWEILGATAPSGGSAACPVSRSFRENVVVHEEVHQATGTERRNLYLTAMPIKGPDGKPEEVLVMLQDLSDLELVRRSELRYRQLFERSPDAMLMVEPSSGRIVIANPVASKLTGHDPRRLPGLAVEALHDPEDWPQARRTYEQVFAHDGPITAECVLRTAAGERVVANMTATRFELEGQLVVLAEFRDITDRKRLENELRHSQKMDAIGRLAGGVAHDFNNILTIILGQSEMMLAKLAAGDSLRRTAESIEKAAVRGSVLTRQLLAFSRKEVVKREIVNLSTVISGMESMLRTLIGEDIELVVAIEARVCSVCADRGQIEQIVMNLAVNARDAMPTGGKLAITVSAGEWAFRDARGERGAPVPCTLLDVRDTGHGMDAATQLRAFEPFFTTKEKGRGTGLGLSSVYGIVREAGGEISLESALGEGTTFAIRLPIRQGERESRDVARRPSGILRRGHESILLVEDEDDVRDLATEALEMNGYSVHAASSAEEAIDLIIQYDPPVNLLLTDVIMPGLSGGELAQRLTACRPKTRVLYMSGYNDDAIVRHGVSDSNAAFIQKPFTLEGLSRRVREILDRPAFTAA